MATLEHSYALNSAVGENFLLRIYRSVCLATNLQISVTSLMTLLDTLDDVIRVNK